MYNEDIMMRSKSKINYKCRKVHGHTRASQQPIFEVLEYE